MKVNPKAATGSGDMLSGFDVIVVGGGNAALCAALTAREAGATVLVLESAPFEFRGATVATPGICAICMTRATAI